MTAEAFTALAISGLLVILWVDDWRGALRDWHQYRDARSFRSFLEATLIVFGVIAFALAALGRYVYPDVMMLAALFGWIVRSGLLIVGIVVFATRRRP